MRLTDIKNAWIIPWLVGFFKDYAKTFTTPVFRNFFWWLFSTICLRLAVSNSLLKAFNFSKNSIKQITGARKCNINRYLICVNKRLLWITRSRSQDLPSALVLMYNVFSKLESFKWQCYRPISGNYHLNNLSRLSGLMRKFALFHVTGCLFPRKSRKSGPHCSCMKLLFDQLIRTRFIPFWMNII